MENTNNPAYWEVINNSLWKQQNIIEFIDETLGDLYVNKNPNNLQIVEMRLIAIEALVDSIKDELRHIIPLIEKQRN